MRTCIRYSKRLYNLFVVILVLVVAGCSGQEIKYPAPSALKRLYVAEHRKRKVINRPEAIKKGKQKAYRFENSHAAIKYYATKKDINSRICLAVYYLRDGKIGSAQKIISNLGSKTLNSGEYSKVYALAGLVRFKKGLKCRDYFELAYAYNENNTVAVYMLSGKHKSFKVALSKALEWCRR